MTGLKDHWALESVRKEKSVLQHVHHDNMGSLNLISKGNDADYVGKHGCKAP